MPKITFVLANGERRTVDPVPESTVMRTAVEIDIPGIVEIRPSARDAIGMEYVAKSALGGYTMVMCASGPTSMPPTLRPKLPYDPLKDFEPVSGVAVAAQVFMTNPSSKIESISDLVALAKSKPGAINYGSSGIGTAQQLFMAAFTQAAGINLTHVANKGSSPAMTDLLGGPIQLMSDAAVVATRFVRGGEVRLLAVTSLERLPVPSNVQTLDEQGIKGYDAKSRIEMCAPAATLGRFAVEVRKVLKEPETKATLGKLGGVAMSEAREDFRKFIRSEIAKWHKVVVEANVKIDYGAGREALLEGSVR